MGSGALPDGGTKFKGMKKRKGLRCKLGIHKWIYNKKMKGIRVCDRCGKTQFKKKEWIDK